MNLIEAIKSGMPFRQPRTEWLEVSKMGMIVWKDRDKEERDPFGWCIAGRITADDWEIQEPTVTITRAQFWDAYLTVKGETDCIDGNLIARKLGLGEP